MKNDEVNNNDINEMMNEEELDNLEDNKSEEVPSSDSSDYNQEIPDEYIEEPEPIQPIINRNILNTKIQNAKNTIKNENNKRVSKINKQNKKNTDLENKLKNRKERTFRKTNTKKNTNNKPSTEQGSTKLKDRINPFKKNKVEEKKAKNKATDKAKQVAKETAEKAKKKVKQTIIGIIKMLVANPVFWIVIGSVVIIIAFLILFVVLLGAYNENNKGIDEDNAYNNGQQVCTYKVNGIDYSNIKVQLLECGGNTPIAGEELVDFDKYVLGVVYAENGGAPTEALKVQALAAKSYALRRPDMMGNAFGLKLEQQNGQTILSIRNCTNDQVYCDPDKGCSSDSGDTGKTVYSGANKKGKTIHAPLSEDSNVRTAVAEVNDKILVGSDGNVYYSPFKQANQRSWNSAASSGQSYTEIIKTAYPDAKVSNMSCTTVGGTGNCSTSTPIKLAEGEDYVVSSKFGKRVAPTAGASTFHKGVDLSATTGTPIYSVFDGTVTTSTDNYGSGGKAVLVSHDIDGDGTTDYTSEYFHMSKRDVNVGDSVTGGQKIGEVGSTGVSTGPHLHFGLKDSTNTHIDPLPILNDLKSKKSIFDTAAVCANTEGNSNGTLSGNFPYYNQCTGPWSSKIICDAGDYSGGRCTASQTICTSGCGYTSFSMIASGLNNDTNITPDTTVDFVGQYSSNPGGGAITDAALINEEVLNHYNLKAEVLFPRGSGLSLADKKAKIVGALKSGKAVELLVPNHFVALVGIDANENITLHDPGKVENVGKYTIDGLNGVFMGPRHCSDCFQYAVAYRKKTAVER